MSEWRKHQDLAALKQDVEPFLERHEGENFVALSLQTDQHPF
ncbi:hypothetical protein GFC29_1236 [Anoxybacillus sp. B7M1]|nr:hypothetical protein GFC28_388 [Anoxybacillus sp. B2M1]ANB65994.1 hypothetical protein GFC29_1236 [Anoxybacillus sp. B7M1]